MPKTMILRWTRLPSIARPPYRLRRLTACATWLLALLLLASCSCHKHDFPDGSEKVAVRVRLSFQTDLPEWYAATDSLAPSSTPLAEAQQMRCVVRLYPEGCTQDGQAREFTFTRTVAGSYDTDLDLSVPAGNYDVAVWADFQRADGSWYHDLAQFSAIRLQGDHAGNTDLRDAFRGSVSAVSLSSSTMEQSEPVTLTVSMERPLAKFELRSNDLEEFIQARGGSLSDYRAAVIYSGYMPDTYNLFTDMPTDAATSVSFVGLITQVGSNVASIGFDYVMVNHNATAVSVCVAIYDRDGKQLSVSDAISVPLRRSRHTILFGRYLMTQSAGGIGINPNYNGDHNIHL